MISWTTDVFASAYCCMYFHSRRGQLALACGVELAVGGIPAQPVAEEEHPVDLLAARAEHVHVDVGVGPLEQAVLEPVGLPDPQAVAGGLQLRHVRGLVGRVRHLERDVDDRLGGQARHRRRADVLDPDDPVAEGGADPLLLTLVQARPVRVVVVDLDGPVSGCGPPIVTSASSRSYAATSSGSRGVNLQASITSGGPDHPQKPPDQHVRPHTYRCTRLERRAAQLVWSGPTAADFAPDLRLRFWPADRRRAAPSGAGSPSCGAGRRATR